MINIKNRATNETRIRSSSFHAEEVALAEQVNHSKPVHFQLLSLTDADFLEKLTHIGSLVTLKLDDFAVLLMFDNSAITGKFLFKRPQETLFIEFVTDALERVR